jgi:hypothetical protein
MTIETGVGRCGAMMTGIDPQRPFVCSMPHGHAGWHRDDDGVEWGTPVPYEAELTAIGLTPEQEIRARALDVAGRKFGSFGYDVEELLDTSDRLVAYIRDGVRVSAEERSDDTTDLGGSE